MTGPAADTAAKISACVVCRNEADRLGPCLESVDWVDEVVVLDLSSSDASADLARDRGARVLTRAPVPIVELVRNEAAAAASHDWILVLDPDERLSPGLEHHLREVVGRPDIDAVVIPRMNYDFGHPPSSPLHRYEPQLRLYRRSAVEWPEVPNALPAVAEERLHRVPYVDQLVIVHDRSRSVEEVLGRVIRYAPAQAQSMIDRGEVFSARAMLQDLGGRTYTQLVRGQAHKDGVPGILRAATLVGFHFWVWASFWQLSGAQRSPEDDRYIRRLGTAAEGGLRVSSAMGRAYRRAARVVTRRAP
jgi:(heptosyl)LPS beta-1,4-glucosyltransferase